ncbi:hypothetical protein F5Y09DRAFT_342631 [Xylaria sp. FL1042]|nr:hypothetical protein F5Y09DRAFT_342631 [Xylaria sp. FL1042]
MGRTEPSVVKPPQAFRRDARAKRARATINKVIPALLTAHPRARRAIECSELIIDPPRLNTHGSQFEEGKKTAEDDGSDGAKEGRKVSGAKSRGRREKENVVLDNEHSREKRARDRTKATSDNRDTKESRGVNSPRITLCVADTLTAAHSLLDPGSLLSAQQQKHQQRHQKHHSREEHVPAPTRRKVGILNMASPLSPGGGFLNGATSQEESLCMCTTLLPALRDEFYRIPELGVVYTPDVLVFRPTSSLSSSSIPASSSSSSSPSSSSLLSDRRTKASRGDSGEDEKDILPKTERWFVDVVSAAMLRLPETEDGQYASAADRELVVRKMRAVLRVFAAKGCTHVVLGAWGCGAYGNPVSEIARAWRRVLNPDVVPEGEGGKGARGQKSQNRNAETWGAFIEDVVFAIKDRGMAAAFGRAFGEDVLPLPTSFSGDGEHGSLSSSAGDEDQNPAEMARIGELREKIAQMETQIEQARSPQLRVGLENVLADLKKQLPPEEGDEESWALERQFSRSLDAKGDNNH